MTGDAFDVVVIGAGLGGLACAARLARAGASVLVVERANQPGGLAGSFHREGFDFELSLHLIDAVGPGQPHRWVLEELGLADDLELSRPEWLRREIWPDGESLVPVGIEPWRDQMTSTFPGERRGIAQLARLAEQAHGAYRSATAAAPGLPRVVDTGPHARRTAAEVVDELVSDGRILARLDLFARGWLGLPLATLSAPAFLVPWYSYQAFGGYYPRGGSAALVRGLVAQLQSHGGELMLRCEARRIIVERGRVRGVELAEGRRLSAPVVVSNASPSHTVGELVDGVEVDGRYRQRLTRLEPSVSCVKVWLGLSRPVVRAGPADYQVYLCPSHDDAGAELHPETRRLSVVRPAALGPGHVPTGRDVVAITMLVQPDSWQRARVAQPSLAEDLADRLVERVERQLMAGLRDVTVVRSVATPETFERYTGHPGGAIYGGHRAVGRAKGWRLDAETPVAGLWLVGAWTRPGAGVSSVLTSGFQTAQALLDALSLSSLGRSGK
ncbi:MAG: NAD(P)/FAD-dependent oxidoreductase [Deltaproteobacteria bacterium]|nr:NAD(P)/FAD-dependent oxidoreductase [Deltaproteobacteria bacterium]